MDIKMLLSYKSQIIHVHHSKKFLAVSMYIITHVHIHVYMYTYMYMYLEKGLLGMLGWSVAGEYCQRIVNFRNTSILCEKS